MSMVPPVWQRRTSPQITAVVLDPGALGVVGEDPAAEAAAVLARVRRRVAGRMTGFADAWLAERGVRFAAEAAVELFGAGTGHEWAEQPMWILLRVREALAAAPAGVYAETVVALAAYRGRSRPFRVATSVLAPTQRAWVDEDVATVVSADDDYLAVPLLAAAGAPEHAVGLPSLVRPFRLQRDPRLLSTFAEGVGPEAATGPLLQWLTQFWPQEDADAWRALLAVIASLPTEPAMQALIERADERDVAPALREAVLRFPDTAVRLLAEAPPGAVTDSLLRRLLTARPELGHGPLAPRVRAVLDTLSPGEVAPAEAVPALLLDPPWRGRGRAPRPRVVPGLVCADEPVMAWRAGEREGWRDDYPFDRRSDGESWEEYGRRVLSGSSYWFQVDGFATGAPEEIAGPMIRAWQPGPLTYAGGAIESMVARLQLDMLPPLLVIARRTPVEVADALMPFAAPEIAVLAAGWLARLKTMRRVARAWLLRHPAVAARALIPPALGPAGAPRRQAEQALRLLATNGQAEAVRAAAQHHEVTAAVDELLAADPLLALPPRIPALPSWAEPRLLPAVRLRDDTRVLPLEAVGTLITFVQLSKPGEPYAGLTQAKAALDPASLAEFGWELCQAWLAAGADRGDSWALDALGRLGDDETVRRLEPVVVAWPTQGAVARAAQGARALAEQGSDAALVSLRRIGRTAKSRPLRSVADGLITEVADALGLTADQLADRLVPDLGLAGDGSLVLDYGPRQFTVGFDEQLRPFVTGLKTLPKPGARDDEARATAAYQQFGSLKRQVRKIAAEQIGRLERAMVTGRRWDADEFRSLFVDHPLMRHIGRRLVWSVYDASGAPAGAVRVAEDGSFADVSDEPWVPPAGARLGVAHPLPLGDDVARWAELFADYEILQPFAQLGREVRPPALDTFVGREVTAYSLAALERRGWQRDQAESAGRSFGLTIEVGGGRLFAVDFTPGLAPGNPGEYPEQTLTAVGLRGHTGDPDPITAAEMQRDLETLVPV